MVHSKMYKQVKDLLKRRKVLLPKWENVEEKGNTCIQQDAVIKCHIEVPHLAYSLSMLACLSSGYTKLGLLCRSKYCCSKFINLGTTFAGHSYMKS